MPKSAPPKPNQTITLRVHCLQPPNPEDFAAHFGLQRKGPGDWIIEPGQRQKNGDYIFQCDCDLKHHDGTLDFSGPYIHGKSGERFLYLSWQSKNLSASNPPRMSCYQRRMKIHLKTITPTLAKNATQLQATVVGRAPDGGPACASVPLLDGGWRALGVNP